MRSGVDPFAAAVYAAMPAPTGLRVLRGRSRVRRGLAALVQELVEAGPVPGRERWWLARGTLIVITIGAGYQLVGPERSWAVRLLYVAVLLVALAAWLARHRTVAGHRVLRAQRREHADLLRSPIGSVREQHGPEAVATAYALGGVLMPGMTAVWGHGQYGDRDSDSSSFDVFPYDTPDR